jgi:hypothetical protein
MVDSEEQIRKISNLSNVFRPNDAIKGCSSSRYSYGYIRPNQAAEVYMFVLLVPKGNSISGNTSMKVPPMEYNLAADINQIFVKHHDVQAFTDYIIKYQ